MADDHAVVGNTGRGRYTVRRYDTSNAAQTVLTDCIAPTTTSCVEHNVPAGTWVYTVQARTASWTGAESSASAAVTVAASTFVLDSTAPITSLPAIVTGTIGNYLLGETLTYHLDSPTGPALTGSPSVVTSTTSMAVSVTLPAGTTDAPHSVFVVGSGGSVASAAIDIVIPPVLQSMAMRDVDANGKVDTVTVVFDDTLAPYTAGIAPWTLANVPSGGTLSARDGEREHGNAVDRRGPGRGEHRRRRRSRSPSPPTPPASATSTTTRRRSRPPPRPTSPPPPLKRSPCRTPTPTARSTD